MAKINISIDDGLLERIDNYADNNYMSRSGLITHACSQFLNSYEIMKVVKDIGLAMRKIADTGNIDHDVMEQLEDFERFCKFVTGVKE